MFKVIITCGEAKVVGVDRGLNFYDNVIGSNKYDFLNVCLFGLMLQGKTHHTQTIKETIQLLQFIYAYLTYIYPVYTQRLVSLPQSSVDGFYLDAKKKYDIDIPGIKYARKS